MAPSRKSGPENWKDRYFKVLNELDDAERACADRLGRLSRDLLAVLGGFRGLDADFDDEIEALARVRELHDEDVQRRLKPLAERVARHLASLEAPAAEGHESGAGGAVGLPEQLSRLLSLTEIPERLRAQAAELRRELEQAASETEELRLLEKLAATLSRLLRAGDTDLAEARDVLQVFIDRLSLPPAAHEALARITPRLQAAKHAPEIRGVAKELAGFVVEHVGALQSEISALNAFLVSINGRLHEVSGHLASEQSGRDESAAARKTLDDSVRRSIVDMRAHMQNTSDAQILKNEIESQLALLDDTVETFVAAESRRASQAEARSRSLNAKLTELERESSKLREQLDEACRRAVRDPLTGLPNRMAYNERMALEYERFQRGDGPLSLIVLDIDRFKAINDTYGHLAGDRVLKHMARELGSQIREQDFFCRYGGEEFVLLLPGTSQRGALGLAESLRAHMEACRFKHKDTRVRVTISCGVSEFMPGDTVDTAFRRADEGLYAAKQDGRNRCMVRKAA